MGITVDRRRALLRFEELRLSETESLPAITDGFAIERLRFRLPDRNSVRGILTRAKASAVRCLGILRCHAHGGRYE
ncbi:hypothetical protein ABID21_003176 [Pseudorhizobium tarimense]|uniref:Uncharacterized protein n=1 Tax=Pseudorhizobium tarimense TaxID=1079109 RepID=A0ABV2H938_9HYPH